MPIASSLSFVLMTLVSVLSYGSTHTEPVQSFSDTNTSPVVEHIRSEQIIEVPAIPVFTPSVQKVVEEIKEVPVTKAAPAPKNEPIPKPVTASKSADCHPSYSGCLIPTASDYDCAGGSGNGPYYTGPVQVLGADVFDLDRDGDGMACE